MTSRGNWERAKKNGSLLVNSGELACFEKFVD